MINQKRTDVMRLYVSIVLGLAIATPVAAEPIPLTQASVPTTAVSTARTTIARADRINVTVFGSPICR